MKSITIAGRLGQDAQTRTTQAGDPVCSFSVAVDSYEGGQKGTQWFDCSLWGRRGEKLAQHLRKGTSVCVAGELGTREHNGKTYLQVRAVEVTLMGGGQRQGDKRDDGGPTQRAPDDDLNDEIPF